MKCFFSCDCLSHKCTSVPYRPNVRGVLQIVDMFLMKRWLILLLCSSMRTPTVCLKCASFIWHTEYRNAASSPLNCSATEEFISECRAGQMLRLLSFSSGLFWFFWLNLSYSAYLWWVFVIGCAAVYRSLSCPCGCGAAGDLRLLTHSRPTSSFLSKADWMFCFDGVHSRPSSGWKYFCWVLLLMCRATWPATSEM